MGSGLSLFTGIGYAIYRFDSKHPRPAPGDDAPPAPK